MQPEQEQEIITLRDRQLTPKQIARKLGLRASEVSTFLISHAEQTALAKFISELLQAEQDSNSDIQVIYPILRQRQHLLNHRFAETLQEVAQKLIADKNPEAIAFILGIIEDFSIHIYQFPLGSRENNVEIAITGYQIVLNNLEPGSEKFANTQNSLSAFYSNRINGSRTDNLERAIGFLEAALTVFTLENFPENWAMTQYNLACFYKDRMKGSRADNLERAIGFYEAALTVFTLEDFPEQSAAATQNYLLAAATQNHLANAYSDRIKGSRADNREQAITFYEAALTVFTLEAFPEDWAMTQNNLARAYSNRIKGSRADNLERAITFYEAALTVRTRDAFPEKWAMTQNNLANAYSDRINGSRADNLERAIEFYEAALTVRTLENFPERLAMTQHNLANAYLYRMKGSRADNLERAIAFCEAALIVRTLKNFPEDWATTQNNLANAYLYRINGSRAENLEQAIGFYESALTVYTLDDFPFNNVLTLNNLGWAYLAKLDYINQEKPEDTNQKAATLQSAYDTFKNAITGASKLRELESGDETKQKHDLQWDNLYKGMVQVCLDRQSNQEALLYAEANKARNLAEVIAQKQETPQVLKPITFTEITQLLTPDTALIEWYITDAEIITFVLTYPDVLTVHRNRQCDELIDLVNDYRADYKQDKNHWQTKLADYLQRLAEILQITTILPSESTRLILIPHWLLHLFPLHALPLTDDEFLLDRFTQGIQYSPSCQLLQQITIHPNFDQLLALQNPTLDLDYTELEVASIAPKFAISQILPGSEASKTNLLEQYLEQLENAHCAHFSCHGSFNADEPLKSFLILSGGIIEDLGGSERYVEWRAGKTADIDKCLTLAEIFGLRFKQCRLVVLSACETALIDTQNRSDYIGLPTGFLYAGAMGTLASLWAVNDLSTALMMVKFYEVLKPGVSIGQALHDTQRWFKSAITSDLLEWVEGSESFEASQKKQILKEFGGYDPGEKPYGKVYHWGAFCAIGL
jgi:CHAT domain-containing protein/predicted enzyme related to lactoylglutathione lyase